ncbi:splicing endonuclease positive effector [Diplodia corticola]|uniref:Splicing endonuclease positive effector n=1 Tax=Diplodia corticola TaxID=236234 RepID=A0A1J9QRX5_9PEZI|nr:splicing endonuclease positive effector [Diplodia corticola]OJD31702.1 splicing endonuclease positive effector [Diplodia corticola]
MNVARNISPAQQHNLAVDRGRLNDMFDMFASTDDANIDKETFHCNPEEYIRSVSRQAGHQLHRQAREYGGRLWAIWTEQLTQDVVKQHKQRARELRTTVSAQYYLQHEVLVVFAMNSSSCIDHLLLYYKPWCLFEKEAGSAIVSNICIPLATFVRNLRFVLLPNDHKQLQHTVESQSCNVAPVPFRKSLFQMLMEEGRECTLLESCHRMVSGIGEFTDKTFYNSNLKFKYQADSADSVQLWNTMKEILRGMEENGLWDGKKRRFMINASTNVTPVRRP